MKWIYPVQRKCKCACLHQLSETTLLKQIKKPISSCLKGMLPDTCKLDFYREVALILQLIISNDLRDEYSDPISIFNVMDRIPKA